MKNYPYLNSILKKSNRIYQIGMIIAIIAFLVGGIWQLFSLTISTEDAKTLNDVLYEPKANVYSYVDVEVMTDYFAYLEDEDKEILEKYYFVFDQSYAYIALLEDEMIETTLSEIYDYSMSEEDIKGPSPVRIYGMTKRLDEELIDIVIESYNEIFGEEILTKDNYYEYVGALYLDTSKSPSNFSEIPFIAIIVGLAFAVSYGLYLVKLNNTTKKNIALFSEEEMISIATQIETGQAFSISGMDLYLTKDYVVDLSGCFTAIPYKDIMSMKEFDNDKTNVFYSYGILFYLKDGSTRQLAHSPKKYRESRQALMIEIANRCDIPLSELPWLNHWEITQ